jgi:hypothetical protein
MLRTLVEVHVRHSIPEEYCGTKYTVWSGRTSSVNVVRSHVVWGPDLACDDNSMTDSRINDGHHSNVVTGASDCLIKLDRIRSPRTQSGGEHFSTKVFDTKFSASHTALSTG